METIGQIARLLCFEKESKQENPEYSDRMKRPGFQLQHEVSCGYLENLWERVRAGSLGEVGKELVSLLQREAMQTAPVECTDGGKAVVLPGHQDGGPPLESLRRPGPWLTLLTPSPQHEGIQAVRPKGEQQSCPPRLYPTYQLGGL